MKPIPHTQDSYLCIDFVNSRFTDHVGGGVVIDRLDSPEWRAWFLARWHLAPGGGRAPLEDLRAARATVRRVLEDRAAGRPLRSEDLRRLDHWIASAPMVRRFRGQPEPIHRDWGWVIAEVVDSAARLIDVEDRRRLKTCANPGCSWLFLDESRNLSRRWCDPASCGNLITVRRFRRRQRATAATT